MIHQNPSQPVFFSIFPLFTKVSTTAMALQNNTGKDSYSNAHTPRAPAPSQPQPFQYSRATDEKRAQDEEKSFVRRHSADAGIVGSSLGRPSTQSTYRRSGFSNKSSQQASPSVTSSMAGVLAAFSTALWPGNPTVSRSAAKLSISNKIGSGGNKQTRETTPTALSISNTTDVADDSVIPKSLQSNEDAQMQNSGSEGDFVMIEKIPERPWRAVEGDHVSARNDHTVDLYQTTSLRFDRIEQKSEKLNKGSTSQQAYQTLTHKETPCFEQNSSKNKNSQPAADISRPETFCVEEVSAQHVASVVSDSHYISYLTCAVAKVADTMVLNALTKQNDLLGGFGRPNYSEAIKEGRNISFTPRSATNNRFKNYNSVLQLPVNLNGQTHTTILFISALSLYLHALGRMKCALQRVQTLKKNIENSDKITEMLHMLIEDLSNRFRELAERADTCEKYLTQSQEFLQSTETQLNVLRCPYPAPEPLLYKAAMEIAREASVEELLGNFDKACGLFLSARLLIEVIMMTANDPLDRKNLQGFANKFTNQHSLCARFHSDLIIPMSS